jgi:hypothetical protein
MATVTFLGVIIGTESMLDKLPARDMSIGGIHTYQKIQNLFPSVNWEILKQS